MKIKDTLSWSANPPAGVAFAHHKLTLINYIVKALIILGPQREDTVTIGAGAVAYEIIKTLPQAVIDTDRKLIIEPVLDYSIEVVKVGPEEGMTDPFKIGIICSPANGNAERTCVEIDITDCPDTSAAKTALEITVKGPLGSGRTIVAAAIARALSSVSTGKIELQDTNAQKVYKQGILPGSLRTNVIIKIECV